MLRIFVHRPEHIGISCATCWSDVVNPALGGSVIAWKSLEQHYVDLTPHSVMAVVAVQSRTSCSSCAPWCSQTLSIDDSEGFSSISWYNGQKVSLYPAR